ncbi:MAG: hypothetical protein KJS97_06620 [Alphaproteobacteria bacterium]|nr:hypothetical protein [Alphaproteobacteria bacterium]
MRVRPHARTGPAIVADDPRTPVRRLPPLVGLSLALGLSLLAWTGIAAVIRALLG